MLLFHSRAAAQLTRLSLLQSSKPSTSVRFKVPTADLFTRQSSNPPRSNGLSYSTDQPQARRTLDFDKNYLVYELENNIHPARVSIAGLVTFGISIIFYYYLQGLSRHGQVLKDRQQEEIPSRTERLLLKASIFVNQHAFGVGLCGLTLGFAVAFLCQMFCVSSVKSITLLKGGQEVIVRLFRSNPFSTNYKPLRVPLNDLCFMGSRKDKKSYIQLSIYRHRGFYLLDKDHAAFHEFLFDKVVGLYRNLKRRDVSRKL